MGYHFVLGEARYPQTLLRTTPATATFHWHNAGAAPIYVPCRVAAGLLDAESDRAATCWPPECEPKSWLPDKTVTETLTLHFDAPPGSYRLAVGLFEDREAKSPWIRLAIEGETVQCWHVLGLVKLQP